MEVFDWYQGTVRNPLNDVLEALHGIADGLHISHTKGMHGYGATAVLGNPEHGAVAKVMHGGTHEYPHVVLSGEWAQPGAELIRANFPDHQVSRLDVRVDFTEEGAYDAIQPKLLETAKVHRVKVGTAGDHLLTMKGRTLYLGSPTSASRMRLYDKREEVLSKMPPGGAARQRAWLRLTGGNSIPDHWVRLEAQVRPQTRESRTQFASITPRAALGSSAWMRDVWQAVSGLQLEPVQVGRGYRPDDDERAYRFMLAQYGSLLRRKSAEAGSWECLGLQIGHDLSE